MHSTGHGIAEPPGCHRSLKNKRERFNCGSSKLRENNYNLTSETDLDQIERMQDQCGRDAAGNTGHHVLVFDVREEADLARCRGTAAAAVAAGASSRAAFQRRHDDLCVFFLLCAYKFTKLIFLVFRPPELLRVVGVGMKLQFVEEALSLSLAHTHKIKITAKN